MTRLRRSSCDGPGIRRVRRRRGFSYRMPDGTPLTDADRLAQIAALAVPPAWRREHVVLRSGGRMTFDDVATSGLHRTVTLHDPTAHAVVSALVRRKGSHEHLFAYRIGNRWHDVTGADINEYVRERLGDATAKDFRTWRATVLAAVALAVSTPTLSSRTARTRAVARAMREVSGYLGNTPAVCRASYVDPRVVDRFHHGRTIEAALGRIGEGAAPDAPATHGALERAVLCLLAS